MRLNNSPTKTFPLLSGGLLSAVLTALLPPAWAQVPPNAGQILQQMAPPMPSAASPYRTPTDERIAAPGGDGLRVRIKGVRIAGASAFAESELESLVADAVGRELSLADLDALAGRITRRYQEAGYLVARAWLPPQEITDGVVSIVVQEGRIGTVSVDNRAGIASSALAPLSRLTSGDVVRADLLDAGLLAVADLPGVEVKSTLRPGATVGTSDFLVEVLPGAPVSGSVDFDSFGNRYTGTYRAGATLLWNNPAGLGDQVSVRAQASSGSFSYGRLGYQVPVGISATRVGAAWSDMRYKLGENFSSLMADGTATVGSLYLQQPFLRSRGQNWYGQVQYDDKRLMDRVGATATTSSKALRNWTAGINGNFSDGLGGGAGNAVTLSYEVGHVGLDAVSAAIDQTTARSQGNFSKWSASYQRTQRLIDDWLLALSMSGQGASKNLDSSEKFALGGPYGVRAYPQGEASGDEGHLVSLELRYPLGAGWEATGFYDDGRVRLNHKPWTSGANSRHLAGYGLGATYGDSRYAVHVFAAWKGSTGQPLSDRDRTPRLWVQAARYF